MGLGNNIKLVREAMGMTLEAVGLLVGISKQGVGNLEGRESDDSARAALIAMALGVPLAKLKAVDLKDKAEAKQFLAVHGKPGTLQRLSVDTSEIVKAYERIPQESKPTALAQILSLLRDLERASMASEVAMPVVELMPRRMPAAKKFSDVSRRPVLKK